MPVLEAPLIEASLYGLGLQCIDPAGARQECPTG